MKTPSVDGARLWRRLEAFAAIGATPAGGVSRLALSVEDRRARALLTGLARERGFAVYQDALANLFVRRQGRDASVPPVLIGSHLDSQPLGGRYDGALGVLAAFECLESLEDAGTETARAVELVAWTNEEGARFAPGAMGSRAFSMGEVPDKWALLRDAQGMGWADELAATLAALPDVPHRALGTPLAAYIELHIEQGPVLEKEGLPIGVVTGTQATRWLDVIVEGKAGHAGTTPLDLRRDPMAASCRILDTLYGSLMPGDPEARFTVGRIELEPGSVNAIPKSACFSVDLRHPADARVAALETQVVTTCRQLAEECGCTAHVRRSLDMPAAVFPEEMLERVEEAARRTELPCRRLASGAFHHALFIASVAPVGMIFVPCRDGISHNEAESIEPEQARAGASVLLETALACAG